MVALLRNERVYAQVSQAPEPQPLLKRNASPILVPLESLHTP